VLRYRLELIRQSPASALAPDPREAIAEGFGHHFGLGFAGCRANSPRAFGFCMADAEGHINTCRRLATAQHAHQLGDVPDTGK
jgi:hypothetical protein